MKRLQSRRTGLRRGLLHRRDLGFSMIELMVVLGVVAILGAVAAVGFRRNEFSNMRTRFVADVEGVLVQARNAAIDQQTRVRVIADAESLSVTAFNNATNTWVPLDRAALTDGTGAATSGGALISPLVCVYGFTPGVQAPSQGVLVDPPADCLAGDQTLIFESDGRFSDPGVAFSAVPNAGATLWIADRTLPGQTKYSIVQIFPGGLVRSFEQLD